MEKELELTIAEANKLLYTIRECDKVLTSIIQDMEDKLRTLRNGGEPCPLKP